MTLPAMTISPEFDKDDPRDPKYDLGASLERARQALEHSEAVVQRAQQQIARAGLVLRRIGAYTD